MEYQGDGNKAIFYYIAEQRVDFRQLIKVLAETFQVRIEMKQIGLVKKQDVLEVQVRAVESCCSTFLNSFSSLHTRCTCTRFIIKSTKLAGQCTKTKMLLKFTNFLPIQKLLKISFKGHSTRRRRLHLLFL